MEFILKASAITIIFYCCYKLFLQRDTFFASNRWFLLSGLVAGLCMPLVVIPIYITEIVTPQTNDMFNLMAATSASLMDTNATEPIVGITLIQAMNLLYAVGVLVFFVQFLIQLSSLIKLIIGHPKKHIGAYKLIEVNHNVSPFSFFNYIVYNPSHFNQIELQSILNHEKVHVNQWHSLDLLFMRLMTIVMWFNPIIWLYKKDLEQNLEFIADDKAQQQADCEKIYQHILLKSSVPNYQLALTNNFYNSLIKKRIVMLHKNRSQKLNQLKIVLVLPLIAIFLMSFNTKEIITYENAVSEGIPLDESIDNTFRYESAVPQTIPINENKGDKEVIMITKNTSDAELDKITKKYKEKGMTLKFKGVKRNSNGEITKISVSMKSGTTSGSVSESNNDGISPIKITVDGENIYIGEGKHDTGHRDYVYETKDGNHVIHKKSKNGASVFVQSDHDSEHEHDVHEIIEDDDKIIIKSGSKVKEIKKHKGKNVWISDDDEEVIEIKGEGNNSVYIIKKDKDGNVSKSLFEGKNGKGLFADDEDVIEIKRGEEGDVIIIERDKDGKYSKSIFDEDEDNVWISGDDENSFKIKTIGKGKGTKVFFSDGDGEPLIILDGKEISQKEMDDLDSDNIETIEVLKGESATKKYGKKAKDGVVVITSKKKN